MKKVIASLVIVLFVSSLAFCAEPEGKRIIFLIQQDRKSDTLELDANLILKTIQDAKNGDVIEGLTLDGKQVFTLQVTKKNPLEMKRDRNVAVSSVRQFYLSQISNPTKPSQTDVAGALRRGIQKANSGNSNDVLLVFLSSGVHRSPMLELSRGYPSDSFAVSPKSVFNIVPQQASGKRIEVMFVSQNSDYISPLHGQKLERFYSLLIKKKGMTMIAWTEDHNAAGDVIKSGRRLQTKPPIPENESGPLILYFMDGKVKYIQEKDSEPTSIRMQNKQPSYPTSPVQTASLACSLLKFGIESGIATIWASVRGPQDTVVQGLRPDSFEVFETTNGRSTPIRNFSVLSKSDRLAVAVVLVRDVSPSQGKDALAISENALKSFLDDMLPDDMAGLVTFAGHSYVKKLTDNKDSVKKSMHVPLFRISTAFYDALDTAIGMLSEPRKGYLNTIIAFTDGQDTDSKKSVTDVIKSAKQASIPIFIIGVGSVNEPELRMIAQQTNGLYFPAAEQMTLDKIYSRLSEMLNNTIVISYPTTAKRGNDVQTSVNVNYTNGGRSYEGQFQSGIVKAN